MNVIAREQFADRHSPLAIQRKAQKCPKGLRKSRSMWVFKSLAKGIQGVFVGYSRGIRVQKRVFRNMRAMEPMKTFAFLPLPK